MFDLSGSIIAHAAYKNITFFEIKFKKIQQLPKDLFFVMLLYAGCAIIALESGRRRQKRPALSSKKIKEDLQNTTVFTEDVEKMAAKMKDAEVFKGFLDHTSYAKLADLAATGHGGKLEDMVRDEVRAFSTMQATNYTLPDVDAKYAPTHGERLRDIKNIMMYKEVKLETANAFQNAITVGKADPAPASQLDNPVVNQR